MFHFLNRFFPDHLNYQIKELYLSVAILDFAVSAVMIFEPIYLWTLGFSLSQILLFYIAVYFLYFFILPLGGKIARKKGYEHSILYSSPFLILYYLSLLAIPYHNFFILSAIITLALQKMLYWPGYHADLARFGETDKQGRQLSNLVAISSLAYIVGPFIGGVILSLFGFKILFVAVAFLILLSNLPLLLTREEFIPVSFSYLEAYRVLFKKENWRAVLSYMGYGEDFIVLVLWPIFIYLIVKEYFSIGIVISLATLFTTIVVLFIGSFIDKKNKYLVLRDGTLVHSLSWLGRIFISNTLGVFLIDTLSRITRNLVYLPQMSITYEKARNSSVMKTIIFFEMSLIAGKLLAGITLFLLLPIFPQNWTIIFSVAAAMSLLYGLLR